MPAMPATRLSVASQCYLLAAPEQSYILPERLPRLSHLPQTYILLLCTMQPCCVHRCSFPTKLHASLVQHQRRCRFRHTPNPFLATTPKNGTQLPPCTKRPRIQTADSRSVRISNHPSDNVPLAEDDEHHSSQLALALRSADAVHLLHSSLSSPRNTPASSTPAPANLHPIVSYIASIATKLGKGKADELINLLKDPDYSQALIQQITSVSHWLELHAKLFEDTVGSIGFESRTIRHKPSNITATLYLKNPVDVLLKQLRYASRANTFFQTVRQSASNGSPTHAHPMASKLGTCVYKDLKHHILHSQDPDVIWLNSNITGIDSFIGFVQLYSEKSSNSLKNSSITSYPLHITLLSFSDSFRRHFISRNYTLLGYFPTSFEAPSSPSDEDSLEDHSLSSAINRTTRLELIQEALQTIPEPLAAVALKGFPFRDENQVIQQCHPVIANYAADIPEAKDILAFLHGIKPLKPCHRCLVPRSDLSLHLSSLTPLTASHTLQTRSSHDALLKDANNAELQRGPCVARTLRDQAASLLHTNSLSPYYYFFESYPLLKISPLLTQYSIFSFEPLHNFHLGISKLVKLATIERLKSDNLFTTIGSSSRSFKSIRSTLLTHANNILADIEVNFSAPGLHIDFSTAEKGKTLNGFFTPDGIKCMLEAKDYRAFDMLLPFVGSFFDRCCNEVDTAPITSIFTTYADLFTTALHYNTTSEWTHQQLRSLQELIKHFKHLCVSILCPFQASHFGTLKFHLLGHIVADIKLYGGLHFTDAGIYEHAHLLFKNDYRRTSRRSSTAHRETIDAIQLTEGFRNSTAIPRRLSSSSNSHTLPARRHSMVCNGTTILFRDIITAEKYLRANPNCSNASLSNIFTSSTISFITQISRDAISPFHNLCLEAIGLSPSSPSLSSLNFSVVNSAFIRSGFNPSLQDVDRTFKCIRFREPWAPVLQRIFATTSFGPSELPKFSHILVSSTSPPNCKFPTVWVCKLLALLRFRIKEDEPGEREYAFVRFFELTDPLDHVDETLKCITLRWATDDEHDHTILPALHGTSNPSPNAAPWFGLVPFSAIKSSVHLVRQNYPARPFFPPLPWQQHRFYMNRFFRDPRARAYSTAR